MFKFLWISIFICLFCEMYSQIVTNMTEHNIMDPKKKCDTINLDENFIVLSGQKFMIDTNDQKVIEGLFYIEKVYNFSHHSLMAVTQEDTSYIVFDSTIINGPTIQIVDTFYTRSLLYIMIDIGTKNNEMYTFSMGNVVKLKIISMYNFNKIINQTFDCDHCYVFVWNKKIECFNECSFLWCNLYRLI